MTSLNTSIFALVDCNNFYASCERIFNPKLINKPLVILSNNDGCFISRSNEAKALGIPMGVPFFKYEGICKAHNISVLSSNYTLYGDISNRIMNILKSIIPEVEIYSIDEAFLRLDNLPEKNLIDFCKTISAKILQEVGIPISIGLGSTKTLAKIANYYAKKSKSNVFSVLDQKTCEQILKDYKVKDIWGIGKNINIKLNEIGIYTAQQLKDVDTRIIRRKFGIIGEKIVYELRGLACHNLETIAKIKKNIVIARSFSKPLTELSDIEEALSNYASTACNKMRKQNSKLQGICVFIVTNWYLTGQDFYKNSITHRFDLTTDNTMQIITAAKRCLSKIYKENYKYKKVGIILLDLNDNKLEQRSLLTNIETEKKTSKLMKILDQINDKNGKGTIFFASEGIEKDWKTKAYRKSPNYISDWQQLITAN